MKSRNGSAPSLSHASARGAFGGDAGGQDGEGAGPQGAPFRFGFANAIFVLLCAAFNSGFWWLLIVILGGGRQSVLAMMVGIAVFMLTVLLCVLLMAGRYYEALNNGGRARIRDDDMS